MQKSLSLTSREGTMFDGRGGGGGGKVWRVGQWGVGVKEKQNLCDKTEALILGDAHVAGEWCLDQDGSWVKHMGGFW